MSSYQGHDGVWCTYAYLNETFRTVYILRVYNDIVPAARACAKERNGSVLFWPYAMDLIEAITWWAGKPSETITQPVEEPEDDAKIHLYPVRPESMMLKNPICIEESRTARVQLNRNAIGPICVKCQEVLGRTIT